MFQAYALTLPLYVLTLPYFSGQCPNPTSTFQAYVLTLPLFYQANVSNHRSPPSIIQANVTNHLYFSGQ